MLLSVETCITVQSERKTFNLRVRSIVRMHYDCIWWTPDVRIILFDRNRRTLHSV